MAIVESDPGSIDLYTACAARFGWRPAQTARLDADAAERLRIYFEALEGHAKFAAAEEVRHAK